MLILERQGESVDDTPQYLKQLCNAVVAFGLINESVKYVAYGLPMRCTSVVNNISRKRTRSKNERASKIEPYYLSNKRAMWHELAINPMQNGLCFKI